MGEQGSMLDGEGILHERTGGSEHDQCVLQYGRPWASLVAMRDQYLSQALVRKYLADATGRAGLTAVRKGTKKPKHRKILYIAFRLLANAFQVCRGERFQVWRLSDSEERAFLMGLRRGECGKVEDLLLLAETRAEEVRCALQASLLPETAHPDGVDAWLSEVREWCCEVHVNA